MGKKRRVKKMSSTAAKVYNFSGYHKNKIDSKYTQVKPIKRLTEKEMESTAKMLRGIEERD